ncbi:hypothetical protein IMCC3317_08270 [Kordia antarctica]|uniref:Knr4/Smi1-like domain-containing protein n=1 Tax=Kordia antarctica TaxID=1218801 RepID=A0A7L4ZGC7_9FLAO|nr:SMI1/KNR4 family protein [Kordia antarctica]QHI35481.1 hypothetical protein IMCC3317_08270 [Kordia antarctica]
MFENTYALFNSLRDRIEPKIKKSENCILGFFTKLSEAKIKKFQDSLDIKLSTDIKKLYRTCNGLIIDWKMHSDTSNRIIIGKSEVYELGQLLSDSSYFFSGRKEVRQKIWKAENFNDDFYVLDHCEDGNYTVFKIENDKAILFWYNAYGQLKKMSLTLPEYIDQNIKFNAIQLWQEYFLEDITESPVRKIPDTIASDLKIIDSEFNTEVFEQFNNSLIDSNFNKYQAKKDRIDYFEIISEQLKSFKKDETFKKVKFKINPGVSVASLRRFHASTGIELPLELLAFYYQVNGFSLRWTTIQQEKTVNGSIQILSLEEMMGGRQLKKWSNEVYKGQFWDTDVDNFKSVKRFENIESTGNDVVLSIDEDGYKLLLFDDGDFKELNISINEYITKVLSVKGINEWHYHLLDEKDKSSMKIISREIIDKTFPNNSL